MQPEHSVELNEQNFQQILESSMQTPVLIHFWAPMSQESIAVIPPLQQLSQQYGDAVTLALLNCEEQQGLAQQFGVQTLPTIALFKNGQAIDGMGGPQTIEAIQEMLGKHLPSQEELQLGQAFKLVEEGEYQAALPTLLALLEYFGGNGQIKLHIAQCYIETQAFDHAEAVLSEILMQDQDSKYKELIAKLELHKQAGSSPEIQALEEKYSSDPSNNALALELAIQYSQVSRQEEALDILMAALLKDLNAQDGQIKKTMMDILSALGQGNPVAGKYRRQLYSLLY
ncbi:co-chaperone YbbN [Aliivibrio finisterrensis]|uniref:co-chaperone YbbN n=1 Tax=Aliivibrio finisterrensis TaxID=511998 RepID=UPI001020C067|nr:co-chaperone YbbN [Aliivibrio finisterrensis]RYU71082.1 co-chaperone YbbN [Aliivibrio finisterrensis]RYU74811.1 co-chaperone YbbN [Aliivibrio finisterrensis]RYU77256.1 co-chaperone YbbN [Aliivibrio finisterrensis]